MEHTQLEVGSYEPFLFLKYSNAGKALLNQSWTTAIWSHLELCKGTITTTHPWLPKPQGVHDLALTSTASEAGLNTAQHRQINASRIFICVISLSDITSFDGKRITQATYDGMRDPIKSKIH
jgi:hypothetical protein